MDLLFSKFQGTGNDFVILNNLNGTIDQVEIKTIQTICDRRFGVGADGLIIINRHESLDFFCDYYNSDGSKSFCGNGARCAIMFVRVIYPEKQKFTFEAIDGIHNAEIIGDLAKLEMLDVKGVEVLNSDFILNTGSPHYLKFVTNLDFDINKSGREIRYSDKFNKVGINVNFIEILNSNSLRIRTYERGVEAETLSCGTGATAAAMALAIKNNLFGWLSFQVNVEGGQLKVEFHRINQDTFQNCFLTGPAEFVFNGAITV